MTDNLHKTVNIRKSYRGLTAARAERDDLMSPRIRAVDTNLAMVPCSRKNTSIKTAIKQGIRQPNREINNQTPPNNNELARHATGTACASERSRLQTLERMCSSRELSRTDNLVRLNPTRTALVMAWILPPPSHDSTTQVDEHAEAAQGSVARRRRG